MRPTSSAVRWRQAHHARRSTKRRRNVGGQVDERGEDGQCKQAVGPEPHVLAFVLATFRAMRGLCLL